MSTVRALVVDDSRVVRQLVTAALTRDAGITVVGEAADGIEALQEVLRLEPDVVVLDVEMPRMGGLDVVHALHVSHPRLPIIMFSTLTERGAKVTVDALLAGASDCVLKPSRMDGPDAALSRVHDELVPRIKALCSGTAQASTARATVRPSSAAPATARAAGRAPADKPARRAVEPDVVVVGSSTGGPDALMTVLASVPAGARVPILVAQHMPPLFTKMFAARLDRAVAATVREGVDGELLQPGHVYVAPGDHHMEVVRSPRGVSLTIHQAPREDNARPSATLLLRSAARVFGLRTLAVVLTGMGSDGLLGAQAVHDAGGTVLAQDEKSSVVWGMPGAVVRAGLADQVLTPDALARRLARDTT